MLIGLLTGSTPLAGCAGLVPPFGNLSSIQQDLQPEGRWLGTPLSRVTLSRRP